MMKASATNRKIWNDIYAHGSMLWYPAEALVRIVRRREQEGGFAGTILDHGCGSGNVAEFLVRSGHKVNCTDVSQIALKILTQRFHDAKLPVPSTSLIDPTQPLAHQLPKYDHVIAWLSLYYADVSTVKSNLTELIQGLPSGGTFIVCVPTANDLAFRHSRAMPDGSRQMIDNISGQSGAVLTIPESTETLCDWCKGILIRDVVEFGMKFKGEHSEFVAVYGIKS